MEKYFKALGEVVSSTFFLALTAVDTVFFFLGLASKSFDFSWRFYLGVLLLSFIVSSLKIIVFKNDRILEAKSEMPILGLYLRHNQIRGSKKLSLFRVRNLWINPVKDVQIKPIKAGIFRFAFELDGTNILKPDEERDLLHQSDTDTGDKLVYPSVFNPKYATADFVMTIQFKDAKNNEFQNQFNLGKSGIKIISSGRTS